MPEHKILEQNPTLRSDFYEKVNTAVITPHKAAVDSFTETGLVLSDGTALDVDVVICATGYKPCHLPYLPADAVASRDAPAPRVDLYRFLVSPWYRDLYVLGQMELFGPFAPAVEAQARFATAVVSGRVARPSRDDMLREIRAVRAWQSRNLIGSDRHALSAHMAEYVDGLLAPLGANPTLGRVLRGRSPLRTLAGVYFGTPSSAQWRLFGYGKKEELARETVLRIAARKGELSKKEKMLLHGA
jgi:dimethylaniline monooxygenase (N-oxide forming)